MEKWKKAIRRIKKNVDILLKKKGIKSLRKVKVINNQDYVHLNKMLPPLFPHCLFF